MSNPTTHLKLGFNSNFTMFVFLISSSALLISCTTTNTSNSKNESVNLSDREYSQLIENHSDANVFYDGLQNSVDIKSTFLSLEVSKAQQNKMSDSYQWSTDKKSLELEKEKKLMEAESRFFVSIYTPEKKYDDLDKNKTLWRIFIEVEGKQIEAKAKKLKLLDAEIKSLYPYFTTFTTAYMVSVPVSTSHLALHPFSLKITGPIAQTELKFNK